MASIIKANQIQDFGGNSIIGSDGAGNLTTQKTNYPAFFAYPSSSQTATHNTSVKILFQTESYDTNSVFTDSKFTVPSGQAGKYYIYASVYGEAAANATLESNKVMIYINGTQSFYNSNDFRTNQIRSFTSTVSSSFDLSVGDYVEIYNYFYSSASANGSYGSGNQQGTYFGGYRIGS